VYRNAQPSFPQLNAELRQEISAHQQAEEQKQKLLQDLRERVKELEVLHQMARLLQNEEFPSLPILVMTAFARAYDIASGDRYPGFLQSEQYL
jgi:hypothetical protein